VAALREIVEDGKTGLVFEAENSRDLAKCIRSLITDPDLGRRMGTEAARHVRKHHTWHGNARRYRALYQDMGVL
jgi:glycosyltransferase involved in cell wall biosynthesis